MTSLSRYITSRILLFRTLVKAAARIALHLGCSLGEKKRKGTKEIILKRGGDAFPPCCKDTGAHVLPTN